MAFPLITVEPKIYTNDEIDEPILIWYRLIVQIISQGADKMIVSETEIRWFRQQDMLAGLGLSIQPLRCNFADVLDFILQKDVFLSRLIEKVDAEPAKVTYFINVSKIQEIE